MNDTYIKGETVTAEIIPPVSLAKLEQQIAQLKALVEMKEDALEKQMSVIRKQRELIDLYETREAARIENFSNRG